MTLRITKSYPEGDGIHVEACVLDAEGNPGEPKSFHFDADVSRAVAVETMQLALMEEKEREQKVNKLLNVFMEGREFKVA